MKVLYLAAGNDNLDLENVYYQDKYIQRDIGGCMLDVDLSKFDVILATPPCNYWSRANYRREVSEYSQKTKHLLPKIIKKLSKLNKPFIVENVRNKPLFEKYGLYDIPGINVYHFGRHTYWSNYDISNLFKFVELPKKENIQYKNRKDRQGGSDITQIFKVFVYFLNNDYNFSKNKRKEKEV